MVTVEVFYGQRAYSETTDQFLITGACNNTRTSDFHHNNERKKYCCSSMHEGKERWNADSRLCRKTKNDKQCKRFEKDGRTNQNDEPSFPRFVHARRALLLSMMQTHVSLSLSHSPFITVKCTRFCGLTRSMKFSSVFEADALCD